MHIKMEGWYYINTLLSCYKEHSAYIFNIYSHRERNHTMRCLQKNKCSKYCVTIRYGKKDMRCLLQCNQGLFSINACTRSLVGGYYKEEMTMELHPSLSPVLYSSLMAKFNEIESKHLNILSIWNSLAIRCLFCRDRQLVQMGYWYSYVHYSKQAITSV